jgi:uncharacterized repeat protein (TIGR01451 family)
VLPLTEPVRLGSDVIYQIIVSNSGTIDEPQVQLSVKIPDSMTIAAPPRGPTQPAIDGRTVRFGTIQVVRGGETMPPYELRLHADRPGAAPVTAEINNRNMAQPLTRSKTTNILP